MAETYNDFNNSQNFTPPQLKPDFSVGQKIKILETRPDFMTFSAKTQNSF